MPAENQIQRGDLLQRLTRALEIKGVRSPALTLESSVVPIVILEDVTKQSEFVAPKDRSAGVGVSIAAVVGELSGAALINPADSGVIIVLDRVVVSPATAQIFHLTELNATTVTGTYGTGTGNEQWLDKRNDGRPVALQFQGSDPAGISTAPGPLESQRIGSSGPFPFWAQGGIVIRPGRAVVVECVTANIGFEASFLWREISEP